METKDMKPWKICVIIFVAVVIGLLIYILVSSTTKTEQIEDENFGIQVSEDVSLDGTIESMESLRWNCSRITQDGNVIMVEIFFINSSGTEKVEEGPVTIEILNKSGDVITSKGFKITEIEPNYGTAYLIADFERIELQEINNINVIFK
ncbi:MAG: hypothetical protein IKP28_02525 [Clostridia bacterium]|nr:hypothetical protein [Clostridia bacterium]